MRKTRYEFTAEAELKKRLQAVSDGMPLAAHMRLAVYKHVRDLEREARDEERRGGTHHTQQQP